MSQSLSRRSFLKCAGSGAVSLAAALLTGVSAAHEHDAIYQFIFKKGIFRRIRIL